MAIRTPVVVLSCALVVKDLAKGFSVLEGHRRKEGGRGRDKNGWRRRALVVQRQVNMPYWVIYRNILQQYSQRGKSVADASARH